MPRRIGKNLRNELTIKDPVSGSNITLYYRIPTTEERVDYGRAMIEIKDGTIELRPVEARRKFGLKIIEGFEKGSFEKLSEKGWVPFSSEADSENFEPDWKALLMEYASDIIEALAFHVFEGARAISAQREAYTEKN